MSSAAPGLGTVDAENWQRPPYLDWAFQHVADLFPTATVSRGAGPVAVLPPRPAAVEDLQLVNPFGVRTTVAEVIATTWTDGWIVLHDGKVLVEGYPSGMPARTRHILMSVSKSLVGSVVAALTAQGVLAVDDPVTRYVPALEGSGYAGATLRHLLDMRSGIAFSEDYLDPDAEVRVLDRTVGLAPRRPGDPATMYEFLAGLRRKGPHGGPFEYRSCESDVLGWVCEEATGVKTPQLISELVWSRLGAECDADIAVDAAGVGMVDGGISATVRDLARFGLMVLRDGVSATGERVVPAAWIRDTRAGGPDSREAFALSPSDTRMPGGMYRNQFWVPFPDRDLLLCLGIHGQMVYIDPAAGLVAAKVSHWPVPQDAGRLFATVAAFDAIGAAVG